MVRFLLVFLWGSMTFSCGSGRELTDMDKAKLDIPLRALLSGENVLSERFDVSYRSDGTKVYGVIVRSSHPEELRKAGIHVASVFGDVLTVRATREELRAIVVLPSVRSIECGARNVLH